MNIAPGLNGLLAQRQFAQQEQQGQLGQIQGLLGIQQAQQQQGLMQKDMDLRGLLGQKLQAGDQEGAKQVLMQMKPELFAQNLIPKAPEKIDLGDRIGFVQDGQIIGSIPKGATPDATLKEQGANQRHQTASGSAVLGANVSMRGQDLTDLRTRSEGAANRGVTLRGQDLTDQRAMLSAAQGRIPQGYRMGNDGNLQIIQGGPADPNAKAAQSSVRVVPLLEEARNLIPKSTGSYAGAGVDLAGQVVGLSTSGAQNSAKLKALEGQLMMAQPRMEGPQSDKDVALYRQMAGQIGDPTVPNKTKMAALDTIEQLHRRYANPTKAAPVSGPKFLGFE
jgi:hypothetical protein